MSVKLCSPCRQAFTTPKPPERKVLDIYYSPFHEGPWNAFQEQSHASHDYTEVVAACDFCAFVVAYATSDKNLGEYSNGSFADFDTALSRRKQGEPMLAVWERIMYNFEDLFSRGLGLRRQLVNDLNQFDMRIFDAAENHRSCQKLHTRSDQLKDWLPARLVKIILNAQGTPETIRIMQTNKVKFESSHIQYATLSYCWGKKPLTKLLRSNFNTMTTSGMSVHNLPLTFRDAITATNRLGLEYIWIDALCIIQQDAEDWISQSVTMAKVYTYSTITLAAAASSDAHGGLFRDREPTGINGTQVDLAWPFVELEGQFLIVPTDPWLKAVAKSPLLKRAWVFQERLLSRGTVYFAHDMLYWECGNLYASELYPQGGPWDLQYRYKEHNASERLPPDVQAAGDSRFKHIYTDILTGQWDQTRTSTGQEMFLWVWASVVAQYSAGKLTNETDRLIAIDGVAEQMTRIVPRRHYLNGLWGQESLPHFLLWQISWPEETPPSTKVAPSWSWASVNAPVHFFFLFRAQTQPKVVAEVLNIVVEEEAKSNTLENSPSTALILRGPLTEVRFRQASRNFLGPLHRWWWNQSSLSQRWTTINPINFTPMLVFIGKGLKADFPCIVLLDRELRKNTRVFALKIAEADIKQEGGTRDNKDEEPLRGWDSLRLGLREEVWSESGIEERFYKTKDHGGSGFMFDVTTAVPVGTFS
ncbi:hypothetical protein FSPOR_6787 [Fusarium sporotrichioides]|uniref:Heterokaryon incompatibility domain-containing protein n=1 Tax=Fusarium sporotrichioides TaxID=5514 RepID=A0A395S1P6_FUSSP|nr:hypothetical protein FSPOR_6787 [Fusarium sporotrichioides]